MMRKHFFIIVIVVLYSNICFSQYTIVPKEGKAIRNMEKVELKTEKIITYVVQKTTQEILVDNIQIVFKDDLELDISQFLRELEAEKERKKSQMAKKESPKQESEQKVEEKKSPVENQKTVESQTKTTSVISKPIENNVSDNTCILETECGFQVMCYDLPEAMTWMEAQEGCPKGYHLPTIEELGCMCKKHSPNYRVGFGFIQIKRNKDDSQTYQAIDRREYWSSSADSKGRPLSITTNDCKIEKPDANKRHYVRCVKN